MTCETCREYLPEFLEGALPEDVTRNLAEHLDACADCRRAREEERDLLTAARHLPRPQPGTTTLLRISEAIHAAAPPAPRRTAFGPVLDMADLAEYLRVEPEVLGMYINAIPHFELGGRLLFRRVAVERWVAERERSAVSGVGGLESFATDAERHEVLRRSSACRTRRPLNIGEFERP